MGMENNLNMQSESRSPEDGLTPEALEMIDTLQRHAFELGFAPGSYLEKLHDAIFEDISNWRVARNTWNDAAREYLDTIPVGEMNDKARIGWTLADIAIIIKRGDVDPDAYYDLIDDVRLAVSSMKGMDTTLRIIDRL